MWVTTRSSTSEAPPMCSLRLRGDNVPSDGPRSESDPSHVSGRPGVEGGTTSAIGLPKRLVRVGLRVFRICSITARHLALNFETAISSMNLIVTIDDDDGQKS